jgi:hypothetical protein
MRAATDLAASREAGLRYPPAASLVPVRLLNRQEAEEGCSNVTCGCMEVSLSGRVPGPPRPARPGPAGRLLGVGCGRSDRRLSVVRVAPTRSAEIARFPDGGGGVCVARCGRLDSMTYSASSTEQRLCRSCGSRAGDLADPAANSSRTARVRPLNAFGRPPAALRAGRRHGHRFSRSRAGTAAGGRFPAALPPEPRALHARDAGAPRVRRAARGGRTTRR